MDEKSIQEIIDDPNKAILPEQVREAIGHLNATIEDKRQEEVDREKAYHLKWKELRGQPDMTIADSNNESKLCDEYTNWKETKNKLADLRDKRSVLEKKYDLLNFQVYKRGRIHN